MKKKEKKRTNFLLFVICRPNSSEVFNFSADGNPIEVEFFFSDGIQEIRQVWNSFLTQIIRY